VAPRPRRAADRGASPGRPRPLAPAVGAPAARILVSRRAECSGARRVGMTQPHDVLFYVPDATPLLVPGQPLPAGGAETQIVAVARELAGLGLRVAFVVYGDSAPAS